MPRSYRLIIVALGLVLASPNHAFAESSNKQPDAQQSITDSLRNISSRYDEHAERAKSADQQEAPCREGKYGSSADLCAQWKAADAAADSAWWAWAAGIAGVVSTVGVVAALCIGLHANWIARDTARRQLRAYVGLEKAPAPEVKVGEHPSIELNFRNAGHTPASCVRVTAVFGVDHFPPKHLDGKLDGVKSNSVAEILPGRTFKMPMPSTGLAIDQSTFNAIQNGAAAIYCLGKVEYIDVFGSHHKTEFSLMSGGDLGGFPTRFMIPKDGNTST